MFKVRTSSKDLVSSLRKQLADGKATRPAFTLYLRDTGATDALVELRCGRLTVSVINSSHVAELNLDLNDPLYSTVGGLADAFKRTERPFKSYEAVADNEMSRSHSSLDLRQSTGCLIDGGVLFVHQRFSDEELREFIAQGATRHNIDYTPDNVPQNEYVFVLQLAQTQALRLLATDGAKRRGLSATVEDLLKVAEQLERAYRDDIKRQARPIPVAKIKDSDAVGGDVLQGRCYRRSLRTGANAPQGTQSPPEIPKLFEPRDEDVTDSSARLFWAQVKDYNFYTVEIWRDVDETNLARMNFSDVSRDSSRDAFLAISKGTTSRLVFHTYWGTQNLAYHTYYSSNYYYVPSGFTAAAWDSYGQITQSFEDGVVLDGINSGNFPYVGPHPMEPDTTYYYKIFVTDRNAKIVGSSTVRAHTRALRARASGDGISPVNGPLVGGTLIVVPGIRFQAGMTVRIGDTTAPYVLDSSTQITVTSPGLQNENSKSQPQTMTIISPDGQRDIHPDLWTYT